MAKKAKVSKSRKISKAKSKRKGKQSRATVSPDSDSSISVTDGAMKDVFRSAFLKRD
jgi:hypothetical protein